MMQPAWVEVDLGALRHNANALKALVGDAVRLVPVVKANAYGHGAVEVARALEPLPAVWGFAVARAEEALELRGAGVAKSVLVLGPPPVEGVPDLAQSRVTVAVSSREDLASILGQLRASDPRLEAHLKINTGMCRLGVEPDEVPEVVRQMQSGPVRMTGVFSHLANAEAEDLAFAREQADAFRRAVSELPGSLLRHLANSAGLVRLPEARLDLVRPGAILYGLNPGIPPAEMPPVKPALRLVSRLAEVKRLPKGCTVGYGRRYRLDRESLIGLIPVGYADGYARSLSGEAEVLIGGRRAPVVGAVNMDAITVDVTGLPGVNVGDEAVLIGAQGDDRVGVEELAECAGTISHEIPTRLGPRLPRIHRGGDGEP